MHRNIVFVIPYLLFYTRTTYIPYTAQYADYCVLCTCTRVLLYFPKVKIEKNRRADVKTQKNRDIIQMLYKWI